uniref:Esterase, PHB depolymerase family n=1 Tax=Candidatus Kentrum sp. TC TaxID=2126339 RepID=A0A450YK80_9GAMM|nr:MAG: esterase, PHB depolymerase family [Candidatus Kentron sp. TC]
MSGGLRRYEFGEQLAGILGESRRDLRFRVTMMVSGGVLEPGPRGRGSPLATPEYGADLLIGTMAAPQQVHTVDAIRCYRELMPVGPEGSAPGVVMGSRADRANRVSSSSPLSLALSLDRLRFGECLSGLLEFSLFETTRETLANELFGIWINRACPVAALQIGIWSAGRRNIVTRRFELPEGGHLPAWLDPERGGVADPGLFHTVFLPVDKLIEIGRLTTQEQKGISMLNSGFNITKLAELVEMARQGRYRGQWEKLLAALAQVHAWASKLDTQDSRLVEVTDFGPNPGNLRMFIYAPRGLPTGAPLVVALHGCTQSASAYDRGAGWSDLADRFRFALLLPQQHWTNNPLRCFNWFRAEDTARDSGESASIRQMIARMSADHGADEHAVYVTGLSSGGAMTSVMLATYPEVFAGGAIVAGAPYHAADGLQEAFETMFAGRSLTGREWGDRVRLASSHRGPWPKVSVWHGDADTAVAPINAEESIKQWLDVHGLSSDPAVEERVDGFPRRVWQDSRGESLVESYTITGMSHGQPLHADGAAHSCGTAAPFFNDVGISSAYRIAKFWGLSNGVSQREAKPGETVTGQSERRVFEVISMGASASGDTDSGHEVSPEEDDTMNTGHRARAKVGAPFGIDVRGIIGKSLGMAGDILKGTAGVDATGSQSGKDELFGIDVPGIINKSLELAGTLAEPRGTSNGVGKSQWRGEGWELIAHSARTDPSDEPLLFGCASSGNDRDMGNKVRSISCEVLLGPHPTLSYIRKLHLNAAVNEYTKARFSVLVDGLPVDEVSATGMKHTEAQWTQRSDIDLMPFADRTVTLTFEVSAHSNVRNEVSAKAWVDRIYVRDMVAVGEN